MPHYIEHAEKSKSLECFDGVVSVQQNNSAVCVCVYYVSLGVTEYTSSSSSSIIRRRRQQLVGGGGRKSVLYSTIVG